MNEQEQAGFKLAIRVAARMLIDAAEDYEQIQTETDNARPFPQSGRAARKFIRLESTSFTERANLLREQAKLISEITPDMVRRHRV